MLRVKPIVMTTREVTKILRIHRPKLYEILKSGLIEGFKLGADWRIVRKSVEKLTGPIPESFFDKEEDELPELQTKPNPSVKVA
jgi:excisionase family DNA binding protein